nr:short chain dehydrogenase [uncultured bacterium]
MKSAVLITGAAQRVGKEIAFHLAAKGHDIALHYHQSQKAALDVQAYIRTLGVECKIFSCDLNRLELLLKFVKDVTAVFPHCRTLVNNASVFERGNFLESDPEFAASMHRINFESPVFLAQAFMKELKKGHVINMLDTAVESNQTSHFFYLLAKKNLRDFTLMAAKELGPEWRVNAVAPGIMLPSENSNDEEYMKRLKDRLPLRANASISDTCEAVVMLMEHTGLTGQILYIDGGEHLL